MNVCLEHAEDPALAALRRFMLQLTLDNEAHAIGAVVRPRVVVCAANRYGKVIVCGARHYDNPMRGVVAVLQRDAEEYGDELPEAEQGFVDEHAVFMTRQEAWHVACAAKQVRYRVGGDTADGGTLYSENLY